LRLQDSLFGQVMSTDRFITDLVKQTLHYTQLCTTTTNKDKCQCLTVINCNWSPSRSNPD